MKRSFLFSFLLFVFSLCPLPSSILHAQVVINEYSCSNVSSYADNFGQYEDWIELYNTTASSVNLTGWYMSDSKNKPTKWQLGNVTISANGFLRIWASGRAINTGANLHAFFTLTQCKPEKIILSNAAAVVIDSLTLKRTQAGHSRGRTTNGAATWSIFTTPSPNSSNNTATPYQEYATRPTMNVAAGFYASTQNVTITSPDPNITIRYTTNGSTPTATSTVYSAPVVISATKVLRAKAFSSTANIPASFVESNTYFINATHTCEVISIFGDQIATLMGGTQISPATGIEYFDKTGAFKTESYGQANKHGNDSWSYPQRGIDFVSMDQYGYNYTLKDQIFNTKARKEFKHIILKAAANDNYPFECPAAGNPNAWGDPALFDAAHIRDAYVHTVAQKAGMHLDIRTWAPSILYVNGNYWGVYDTREKVDDADYTDYYDNSDSWYSTSPNQDSLQYLKTWGSTWSEYGGTTAQNDWNTLSSFITSNNMAIQANYNYADSLLNVKSLADYIIINSYCVTSDWLNWNTEWWRGKQVNASKKKWRYCLWDEDATFHHYINYTGIPNSNANADPCDPQSLPNPGNQGHVPILNALLQNPGFKQYYVMRYFDLLNTGLSCQRMTDILDSMINIIKPEMPGQVAKWGGSMAAWQQNVSDLRNFILARCDSVMNGYSPCNGATGPYPIKVNIDPPNSGTVDVNSINITKPQFCWSATYPGGVNLNLTAHADPLYCFDHWEFQNHVPQPNNTDTAVYINLTKSDSIIAHFTLSGGAPTITATNTSICTGDSTTLQSSSGTSYLWSPSTGLSCTSCQSPIATPTTATTYSVIVVGNCAAGTGTITINMLQPGTPTPSATNSTICVGQSTTLNVSGGSNYLWSPSTGLSCTTCANPVASPTVTTTYSVSSSGNCVNGTGAVTVNVTAANPPAVTAASTTVCPGGSTTLNANGGSTFAWSPSTGLSCTNCSNPVASPTVNTTYSVTVTGTNCIAGTGAVTITIGPPVPPTVNAANPNICIGGSTMLNVSGGGSFTWSPSPDLSCTNCSNPVASPSVTTTYSVNVSPANCVGGTGAVTVNVNQPPVPNVGKDPTICTTGSTELLVSGGTNYAWSPPSGLSCTNCANPTATPNITTTYYIIVSDGNNCKAIDSIVVYVAGECPDIYLPTGFSPNGDNNNDMLFVFGDMKDMYLVIYNRWGNKVFETWDKTIGWDGKQNGKLVESGVYAYKFSATDPRGTVISKSGNITVVR